MQLCRGPLPPKQNILLNYLTPTSVTSLFRALSNRHLHVTLATAGGFLLKGLIIVSTGLLSLEPQTLTKSNNVLLLDHLNLSQSTGNEATPVDSGIELWAITEMNVPFPPGTTSRFATQSFLALAGKRFSVTLLVLDTCV
jgi:uncharacterized protein YaaQ